MTVIASTCGALIRVSPMVGPRPWRTFRTPFGNTSPRSSAKRRVESGVISEGFSTQVQPVASAGATLAAIWFIGQFQGVISAHTPMGSCRIVLPLPVLDSNA